MRKIVRNLWIVALVVLVLALAYPLRSTLTRTVIVGDLAALYVLTLLAVRRSCLLRAIVLGGAAVIAAFLCLPGRHADPERLRTSYISALGTYRGVRYYWGGETHLGIDCSGLPRMGLTQGSAWVGLCTANPGLVRRAAWLWWNDASASDLAGGWQTRRLGQVAHLHDVAQAPFGPLRPGDIAVVSGQSHVIVYLGSAGSPPRPVWIEADPMSMRVEIWPASGASKAFPWDNADAEIVRWRDLE
jgi:hypothetical protein